MLGVFNLLADRLEESRLKKKMTKKEVADALQIDQSTYGKYELGKREPDAATLLKLADLFEVTTDFILGRVDTRTNARSYPHTQAAHIDEEGPPVTEDVLNQIEEIIKREREKIRREREGK